MARYHKNYHNHILPERSVYKALNLVRVKHANCSKVHTSSIVKGREGVKWELGLALFWIGKMGFTHWDCDLATGNGMNNYKMEMGFLFFSGFAPIF